MPHCENTMMASERCVEYKCMCVFLFTGRTQMMSTTFKMKIKWHEKNRWELSAYSVFNGGWWAISKSKLLVLGGIRWEATEWKITSPLFFFLSFYFGLERCHGPHSQSFRIFKFFFTSSFAVATVQMLLHSRLSSFFASNYI